MSNSVQEIFKTFYVAFAFCCALSFGALKALLVGPVAGLLLILGNVGVILGLFPAHVVWTVYALVKTNKFDAVLKFAMLFALPPLFGIWLVLSIAGTILIGVGYGFFAPWVSTFEAFRLDGERKKFLHGIKDGTWGTIKGSCTVVQDFADFCYHSYPQYLKELREGVRTEETHTIRLVQVPGCLAIGLMGLVVEVPFYTAIAVLKSPYMLFKGWQRLLHDLVSREGPFLETACIPVAGLAILLWPLVVIGSMLLAIFSSFFIGLYGSVIAYQERSFRRGVAYVIAMVSEFDEYTNDFLYLREGSVFPKPRYRKKKAPNSSEFSIGANNAAGRPTPLDAPAMLVPSLAPSRSIRETLQEVTMLQIWGDMMRSCEMRCRELVDANVITKTDLNDWMRARGSDRETVVSLGVPAYALLHNLLYSIKAGTSGLLLSDGVEVTHQNRPQGRLLDWFFHPVIVLKEHIKAIRLAEHEARFLEKITLFGGNAERIEAWNNGGVAPQDALRAAQIQAISRRVLGITRSISKFPTYRRRFRNVVKALILYYSEKEGVSPFHSSRSVKSASSIEIV